MGAYAFFRLARDPDIPMERMGDEKILYIDSAAATRWPGVDPVMDAPISVGAEWDVPIDGSPHPFQLNFYKSLEFIITKKGYLPYEITYVHIPELGYIPFKYKVMDQRIYSLVNMKNLESIYARFMPGRITSFDDPRMLVFSELALSTDRHGFDKRFITAVEGELSIAPFLRSLAYDCQSYSDVYFDIQQITGQCLNFHPASQVSRTATWTTSNSISPLDLDPRIAFTFSHEGPSDPRTRWSVQPPLISTTPSPPISMYNTSTDVIFNPACIRPLAGFLDTLPVTDLDLWLHTDTSGCWGQVEVVTSVDRYALVHPRRVDYMCILSEFTKQCYGLMQAFKHLCGGSWQTESPVPRRVSVRIYRTFNDEVMVTFHESKDLPAIINVYIDLAACSLTTYGVSQMLSTWCRKQASPHGWSQ